MKIKKLKNRLQKFVAHYNQRNGEYELPIKVETTKDGLVYTKINSFKVFIYPDEDLDKGCYFDVVYKPDKVELEIFNTMTSTHIMADFGYTTLDSFTTDGYDLSRILEYLKASRRGNT